MAESSGNIAYNMIKAGKIIENRGKHKLIIENTLKI